jgi:predicted PurR-regulated permease PerM
VNSHKIDVSHKTIFFLTAFLALLWALFLIKEVIILIFIAVIFMSALSPIVTRLEKLKIPKSLAIAIIYVGIIAVISAIITFIVTPFAEETSTLLTNLPNYLITLIPESGYIDRSVVQQEFGNFSRNALEVSLAIFSNFLAFISIAVLTFYLLLERENLDKLIAQFFIRKEERIKRTTKKIEEKLGAWVRGQMALTLIIGTTSYIGLTILGVPYALPLAILAGILEIVPVIGPIISAIPAVMIAFLISPLTAGLVALMYFIIQQLENHLIVPQVMKKAVGLNPLVVIIAVAIGGKLLGIAGALLAVPITVVVQVITEDLITAEEVESAEDNIING